MCVLTTVATDALVLKHQAISICSAGQILFVLDQFHTETLQLYETVPGNNTNFCKNTHLVRVKLLSEK